MKSHAARTANPGTDSQFPANCAGNLVSVPGLRRSARASPHRLRQSGRVWLTDGVLSLGEPVPIAAVVEDEVGRLILHPEAFNGAEERAQLLHCAGGQIQLGRA